MTPQTKRRKFLKKAREEAHQKGRTSIKEEFEPWFQELRQFAKKGKWKMVRAMIMDGPPFYARIECCADISMLFTRGQHALEEQFQKIDGDIWNGIKNETLQKPQ